MKMRKALSLLLALVMLLSLFQASALAEGEVAAETSAVFTEPD